MVTRPAARGRVDNCLCAWVMNTLHKLRTRWLQARIAYHRRKAVSYNVPVVRSFKRDGYHTWLRNMAHRHSMKAHALELELRAAGEQT